MKRYNMGIYGSDPTEHLEGNWVKYEDYCKERVEMLNEVYEAIASFDPAKALNLVHKLLDAEK